MGTTQKFKSAIKSTFKLQPSTFCFPRHRNEDNSVWHHSHIGLGGDDWILRSTRTMRLWRDVLPLPRKGENSWRVLIPPREFWKQSMKSLLKRSFMKLRSPKKCHSKFSNGIAVSSTFWKFLNNRTESENAAKYLESASDNSVILKHRQKMNH